MRTTLTIEDDLGDALKKRSHRTRQPFKQVVNEVLRAGLAAKESPPVRRYRLKAAALGGVLPGVNLDKVLALADALEDEGIARKLEARK